MQNNLPYNDSKLPQGWKYISQQEKNAFNDELSFEIGESHTLQEYKFDAIAKSTIDDDVLYFTPGGEKHFFAVHLTFQTHPEKDDKFLAIRHFDSIEEFTRLEG